MATVPRARRVSPLAALCLLAAACADRRPSAEAEAPPFRPRFVRVPAPGLDAELVHGDPARPHIFDAMGPGTCLLDADGDGFLDVFVVNGSTLADLRAGRGAPNRLHRNRGDWTFEDVSARSGLGATPWGQGCAVGDVDDDGDADLYVTAFGPNRLFLNDGRGVFRDAGPGFGAADPRWSTSAAFADVDRDGHLDLYVANYVDINLDALPAAFGSVKHHGGTAVRVFDGPQGLPAAADALFRGRGDGTFEDVTESSGVLLEEARYGLGVAFLDADDDGDQDILVANDSQPNSFFVNDGSGRFVERGLPSGIALAEDGRAQAGMGVAVGDYDGDGLEDALITHFSDDSDTLYRNEGGGRFRDVTAEARILLPTWKPLGWGAAFVDFDRDTRPDLFIANGHVHPQVDGLEPALAYAQPKMLFMQDSSGRFHDAAAQAGPGLALAKVSRGAAFGDLDEDGDVDVVVANLVGGVDLLRNESLGGGEWLALRLVGRAGPRDATGARVRVKLPDGRWLRGTVRTGGSYLAASDPRVRFGLGSARQVDQVEVRWPSGALERHGPLAAGRTWRLAEGDSPRPEPARRRGAPAAPASPAVAEALPAPPAAGAAETMPTIEAIAAEATVPEGMDASKRLEEAGAYFQFGRLREAMAWAASALVLQPDLAQARFLLGAAAARRGLTALAREHLGAVIAADPARLDARLVLGEHLFNARRLGEAREVLAAAAEVSPRDAAVNWLLGVTLADLGLPAEAAPAFERAAATAERKAGVLHRLGLARFATGDLDGAEAAFRAALADDPILHGARHGLVLVAGARGGKEGAAPSPEDLAAVARAADFVAAIGHAEGRAYASPNDARLRVELGLLHESAGQLEDALREFNAAGSGLPALVEPVIGYARVARKLGKWGKAVEALRFAESEFPPDARVKVEQARIQAALSNPAAAEEALAAALALDASSLEAEEEWARLLVGLALAGDAARGKGALTHARRAAELGSRDVGTLVRALRLCGEEDEARALAEATIKLADGRTRRELREALALP